MKPAGAGSPMAQGWGNRVRTAGHTDPQGLGDLGSSAVRGGRRPDRRGAWAPGTSLQVFPLDGTLPGSDSSLIGYSTFPS